MAVCGITALELASDLESRGTAGARHVGDLDERDAEAQHAGGGRCHREVAGLHFSVTTRGCAKRHFKFNFPSVTTVAAFGGILVQINK